MARLHLRFAEEAFDPRLLELTHRFFAARKDVTWQAPDFVKGMQYDTWVHGACIVHGLPFPSFRVDPKAPTPHGFYGTVGFYTPATGLGAVPAIITLRKYSAVSLFHQYRHHMQAVECEERGEVWCHEDQGIDAQAWACSLFYRVDKKAFRRWVRKGRVAGVNPEDLLKRQTA